MAAVLASPFTPSFWDLRGWGSGPTRFCRDGARILSSTNKSVASVPKRQYASEATFMGSRQSGHEADLTRFQMGSYRSSQERPASAAHYFLPKEKNVSQ